MNVPPRAVLAEVLEAWAAHRQGGRPDGSWGCACGWVQDKFHREHLLDVAEEVLAWHAENGAQA